MQKRRVVIAGGGAAGFFSAITCAENARGGCEVILLEASSQPLAKVKVSGGGRCNLTHACFEPSELAKHYPRGARELTGAFHRWQPRDTIGWFGARGVELKTEPDGRMFPVTDDSQTIIDCLVRAAAEAGVSVRLRCALTAARAKAASAKDAGATAGGAKAKDAKTTGAKTGGDAGAAGKNTAGAAAASAGASGASGTSNTGAAAGAASGFALTLTGGATLDCDRLLLATGGGRSAAGPAIAAALGHVIEPPVPSLFTFNIDDPRLRGLAGLSVPVATAGVRGARLRETGPVLVTHWGLSGPAILRLSAWGARELHARDHQFSLQLNWLGAHSHERAREELAAARTANPRRQVATWNPFALPQRLWERLAAAAGIAPGTTWTSASNRALAALAAQLTQGEYTVTGKSTNKDEFVTCGGVRLAGVDFKTMQSRVCPGLYFAGELLDIDGVTGGFNFQAAWTTGRLAGLALAE
ncbi:MAG: NAD(P)/FAD-dependent oxidoreductase [Opitutaceae bacterium]|jgi:predicted Rossmann fold flavoprotein|nr:NAD(P)/FAD-dependent oxidoreductase [Opitutaceae bacterium]